MKGKKPKKSLNKYIRLTGIGLQMGITIYLASYLGKWLDVKYPNDNNLYTIVLTLIGVGLSFYSLLKQVKNIQN
ncbi:MAG: AtpZ/AtpI family protein [Flavobacteriaceae bacterium]|nr:AtpZ/AtpI family protein [Flavobacteriaceae bacterium]